MCPLWAPLPSGALVSATRRDGCAAVGRVHSDRGKGVRWMPKRESGDQPDKPKARKAMEEIAIRAVGGLLANLLADIVRELTGWPDS